MPLPRAQLCAALYIMTHVMTRWKWLKAGRMAGGVDLRYDAEMKDEPLQCQTPERLRSFNYSKKPKGLFEGWPGRIYKHA